jgi:hypothetical protein
MPTVQRTKGQTIGQESLPGARVSTGSAAENFGGGQAIESVNEQVGAMENDIFNFAIKQKFNADQVAINDADNQTIQAAERLLRDPNTGVLNKRGKDAFGVPDIVNSEWVKITADIEGKLSNEDQKRAYRERAASRKQDIDKLTMTHVANEGQQYDSETTDAFIENEMNAAVLNFTDQDRIQKALDLQKATIYGYAQRTGKSDDWVLSKMMKTVSATHASVVNRMLATGQDILAREYYDKNKSELDGQTALVIDKNLQEGVLRGESQRQADQIMRDYSDLQAAREAVKEITDPDLRDAVDERVQREFSLKDKQSNLGRQQLFMGAYNLVNESKSIDDIPPDQWNALLPSQRKALKILENQKNFPDQIKQDDSVYMKYIGMKDSQLAKVTEAELIENVRPYVNDNYYNELMNRYGKIKDSLNSPMSMAAAKSIYNDKELILNAMKSSKIGGISEKDTLDNIHKNGNKSKNYRLFSESVDNLLMSYRNTHGKDPDDMTKKKIINEALTKTVFISGNEKLLATLSSEEIKKGSISIDKIPLKAKLELVARARMAGVINKNTTDDQAMSLLKKKIEKAYAARVAGSSLAQITSIIAGD